LTKPFRPGELLGLVKAMLPASELPPVAKEP
jgi:DNA-binding response OmpR family regulator